MSSMLKDADICARRVQLFDNALVVSAFRTTVLKAGHFTGDAVGPFQVLDEIVCKGSDIAGRFRERRANVDG